MAERLFESLMSGNSEKVIEKVKELVGRTGDKPQSVAKRIYHLHFGTADPPGCKFEVAAKLCDTFPVLFLELTNKILELSGQGFEPGKPEPSGKIKK